MTLAGLLCLVAVTVAASPQPPKSSGQVLLGRTYFEGELSPGRTPDWTCVTLHDARLHSQPCELTVIDDPGGDGYAPFQRVEATAPGKLFFAVRGVTGLREEEVATVAFGELPLTNPGSGIGLGLGGDDAPRLGIWGSLERGYDVTLRIGAQQQVLTHTKGIDTVNHTGPLVHFAGDLDGDGKLDLLLNVSGHHAGTELRLYLSSHAGPGELVHEVASLSVSNC